MFFQHIKSAAKPVARPESLLADSIDLFRRASLLALFFFSARLGFFLLGTISLFARGKSLAPVLTWVGIGRMAWIRLGQSETDGIVRLAGAVVTKGNNVRAIGALIALRPGNRRLLNGRHLIVRDQATGLNSRCRDDGAGRG